MTWDPQTYDKRWAEMAAAGQDPHGEVAFLERLLRRHNRDRSVRVLDAGCGTGRVAIELDHRGYLVDGTDVDATMLGQAEAKAPHLRWVPGDLATLSLGQRYDLIVMAGNVILFVEPTSRPLVAPTLRAHSNEDALVVAGFQLARADGRRVPLQQWDAWMEAAGYILIERYSTWDDEPWDPMHDYVVSVHRVQPPT